MKDVLYVEDFQHLFSGGRKRVRSICPFCNERRTNKKDKCLSIDTDTGAYYCHYCEAKGYMKSRMAEVLSKDRQLFKPKKMSFIKPKAKNKDKEQVFNESFFQYFRSVVGIM